MTSGTPTSSGSRSSSKRRSLLRIFALDRRGVTAVEFGIVGLPFFSLLLAIFQQGFFFFFSEALSAATQNAARRIYTGQVQGDSSVTDAKSFINAYVCPPNGGGTNLSSLIDCSKLFVDVRPASSQNSFSGVDTKPDFYQSPSNAKFCLGGPNDIVVVRIIYPAPVFAPGLFVGAVVSDVPNNSGIKQLLMGTAVFQNEPYANGYVAPSGC